MNIKTSNRIGDVTEYYFSKKLREIEAMNKAGKQVINLGIGSPDLAPDPSVIETLVESAQHDHHHAYQSYKGTPELRSAIAQWHKKTYGVTLNAESEILPLIGSKEGIMHISMTYLNEGDEVLIPNPAYPTYASATKLAGAKVVNFELSEENDWLPNIDTLEQLITPKTKLLWLNYPNMPTGRKANLATFKNIIQLAKKHNILVCNDNPYSLTLNDVPTSILQVEGPIGNVIELNSLSKSHNMAGWRLGMISGHANRISEILRFKSNMDSGMFLPLQHAAIKALSLGDEWHTKLNTIYAERRIFVWELLDLLKCTYNKNQVGLFIWAKVPCNINDSTLFTDEILKKSNVFITPGVIFGSAGEDYIRISLCNNIDTFKTAIHRIKNMK